MIIASLPPIRCCRRYIFAWTMNRPTNLHVYSLQIQLQAQSPSSLHTCFVFSQWTRNDRDDDDGISLECWMFGRLSRLNRWDDDGKIKLRKYSRMMKIYESFKDCRASRWIGRDYAAAVMNLWSYESDFLITKRPGERDNNKSNSSERCNLPRWVSGKTFNLTIVQLQWAEN